MSDVVILRRESIVTVVREEPSSPVVTEHSAPIVIIQREGIPGVSGSDVGEIQAVYFHLEGGGVPILANQLVDLPALPFAAEVVETTIVADASGSIVVDVQRASFADYPTFVSIAGSAQPTLALAQKSHDTLLTGWTSKILAAGDVLRARVVSATSVTRVTVTLWIKKL